MKELDIVVPPLPQDPVIIQNSSSKGLGVGAYTLPIAPSPLAPIVLDFKPEKPIVKVPEP
jgi:hypothetical protein